MPHAQNRAPRQEAGEPCAPQAPNSRPRAKRLRCDRTFGARNVLRTACDATETSQAELGAALGVTTAFAQLLVEERARFGIDHLLLLAQTRPALARKLWELLEPTEAPPVSLPLDRAALRVGGKAGVLQQVVLQALGDGTVNERERRAIRRASVGVERAARDVGRSA